MNHTHMPDSSTLKGTLYARLSKETQVIFSMMSAQRFNAGNGPLSHGLINKRKDPGGAAVDPHHSSAGGLEDDVVIQRAARRRLLARPSLMLVSEGTSALGMDPQSATPHRCVTPPPRGHLRCLLHASVHW